MEDQSSNSDEGSKRTLAVKRNTLLLILLKGINIGISLLLVPLTLGYLTKEEYGIWMTLTSILVWITFFDIGLTNGLRNKLTEALAVDDKKRARIYVSTTFALILGIIGLLIFIFTCIHQLINWSSVFNTVALSSQALGRVVWVSLLFFGLHLLFNVVYMVFFAVQRAAINELLKTFASLLSLSVIYLLTKITTSGSLLYVAVTFSSAPVLVLMVTFMVIFFGKYRFLLPSVRYINLKYTKDLIGLGINFFLVQISYLVLFTTSNLIIAQLLGPAEVTIYSIANRYFSLVTMGFTIIITPLWSAFTDAYVKGEYDWIRKTMRNMLIFWGVFLLGTVAMVALSPWVYRIWVGAEVASSIPLSVSIGCAVYVSVCNWNAFTACFLNGVGKLRIQLVVSIFGFITYIPLAFFLGKIAGIPGVIYAFCIVMLLAAVMQPLQYFKIINKTARGIWNK